MKPNIDNDEDHFDIGFEQFRLRPGLELEVHDAAGAPLAHRAQFVSAIPGEGVLISIAASDAAKIAMQPGERYRLSGFNGRFDFSFSVPALKVDRTQFTALLALPTTIAISFVRKHQRAALALPATVTFAGKRGPVPVTVRNLSLGGASLDSVELLGAKGAAVTLQLHITFDNKKEALNLVSVIRRVSESSESLMFNSGLEFVHASREDKLLLHYYTSTLATEYNLV